MAHTEGYRPPSTAEKVKYEVAEELGLMPRVIERGWASLTPGETGRIGGIVRARLQRMRQQAEADAGGPI